MNKRSLYFVFLVLTLLATMVSTTNAQYPQIPTLQSCNPTQVKAEAYVFIESRKDTTCSGTFMVAGSASFSTSTPYPVGSFRIKMDMNDSLQATFVTTTIDQLTTTGKNSPTAYLNGRCKTEKYDGCHYWMTIANNNIGNTKTPDVIGILIVDREGKRLAYGTGPVIKGQVYVAPTGY